MPMTGYANMKQPTHSIQKTHCARQAVLCTVILSLVSWVWELLHCAAHASSFLLHVCSSIRSVHSHQCVREHMPNAQPFAKSTTAYSGQLMLKLVCTHARSACPHLGRCHVGEPNGSCLSRERTASDCVQALHVHWGMCAAS